MTTTFPGEATAHHVGHRWVLWMRIPQLILAIIVLGLNAWGVYWISYRIFGFTLTTAICTFIITVYFLVAGTAVPRAYNAWAQLALEILMVIFWLISFALLASLAEDWSDDGCYGHGHNYYYCYKLKKRYDWPTNGEYWGTLVAATVFGAIEFILFLISLCAFGIHLHRHRIAGRPFKPGPSFPEPYREHQGDYQPPTQITPSASQVYVQPPVPQPYNNSNIPVTPDPTHIDNPDRTRYSISPVHGQSPNQPLPPQGHHVPPPGGSASQPPAQYREITASPAPYAHLQPQQSQSQDWASPPPPNPNAAELPEQSRPTELPEQYPVPPRHRGATELPEQYPVPASRRGAIELPC